MVLASRRVDKLKELRARIQGEGGDAHVVELDVTDMASIKAAVARAIDHLPERPAEIHVAGGGRHNATLMAMIAERTGARVLGVDHLGWDGDALEASGNFLDALIGDVGGRGGDALVLAQKCAPRPDYRRRPRDKGARGR